MSMSSCDYNEDLGVDTNLVHLARVICVQDLGVTVLMSGRDVGKPRRFDQRDVPLNNELLCAGVAAAQQPRGQRSFR